MLEFQNGLKKFKWAKRGIEFKQIPGKTEKGQIKIKTLSLNDLIELHMHFRESDA